MRQRALRARAIAIVAVLVIAIAVAVPGGAPAKPGYFKVPGQYSEVIQMRTSDGYRLSLQAFGRRVTVSFDRHVAGGGLQYLTYSLHRRLAPGPDLRFRLGRRGQVDLRFVVGKRQVRENTGCTGGPSVTESGHFVGTLRIRGQRGVGAIDIHRASGVVAHEPPLVCRRVKPKRGINTIGVRATKGKPRVPKGGLELIAGKGPAGLRFEALRIAERELPGVTETTHFQVFDASITRREGDFTVTSLATDSSSSNGGGFVSPDAPKPLSAATIAPEAPFSGSATFEMVSPHHAEWTGDLAVELPGYGRVPLTGPKIAAGICSPTSCTPTLPPTLRTKTS